MMIGCSTRSGAVGAFLCTKRRPARRAGPRSLVIVAGITSNDIRNGMVLDIDNTPWKVQEFLHVKPGKGSAFVRSKLKNLKTGSSVERTFRAGEPLEVASVERRDCQFTYVEGSDYVFMDMASFEETRLPRDDSWANFILEGTECILLFYNGEVISVDLPVAMDLEVIETDPGVKGNTAQGGTKNAKLATGLNVQVPLFIEVGDILKVNTATGAYLSRVEKA